MPEPNRATIATYLREHYRALVGYARSLLADTPARDGEDIVQDVVLGLLGRPDAAGPIEGISLYIYTALRNRVIDELRKPAKDMLSLEADLAPGSDLRLADVLADVRVNPAEAIERDEVRERLYQAMAALPAEQRAVIIASEMRGALLPGAGTGVERSPAHALGKDSLALDTLGPEMDLALACGVVHEVPDAPRLLAELARVLKVNARLLIAEPQHVVENGELDRTLATAQRADFDLQARLTAVGRYGA